MNWDEITPELNKKLDPAYVKKPTGQYGPKGDYLEGWHVINEANAIFGFGGWSYNIVKLSQDALEQVEKNGKKQWQAAYTCIVRLTVGEAVREDVGFGSGFAAQIGDAIEGATKEAVTDALKRCLRTFGNRFGLALYDKSRANVGVDKPHPLPADIEPIQRNPVEVATALVDIVNKAQNDGVLSARLKSAKFSEAWQWLDDEHPDEALKVRRAVDAAQMKFASPEAAE